MWTTLSTNPTAITTGILFLLSVGIWLVLNPRRHKQPQAFIITKRTEEPADQQQQFQMVYTTEKTVKILVDYYQRKVVIYEKEEE